MTIARILILALAGLLAASAAAAEPDALVASPERGWPQFRGPRRDGISDEKGLLATWPAEGPPLAWKADQLGRGWSSPIVVGGIVYLTGDVGDDLVIWALNATDGKLKWKATNGRSWTGQYPGARASPAYSDGRLYHLNAHGRLACLDAQSGKEAWTVDVLARFDAKNITWAISENLLIDEKVLYVTPGSRTKGMVAALDKATGQTLWASDPLPNDAPAYSSPILFHLAGRKILAGCSAHVGFGMDAQTGKLLWTVPLRNPYGATVAIPVYGGDGQLFYSTPDGPNGTAYRLTADGNTVKAEQLWRSPVDPLTGAAIYADGRLYVLAEDGTAALLNPTDAAFEIAGRFKLTPARKDAWAHPVLLDARLYLRHHDALWCFDVRAK